ncbi:MAG: hypothetical protein F2536_01865 [Actinobacteria bacterium]|uniref:Unannotated protein n=1 Tax=freshwater metagenome TaxID=449393 RepID=A0A6J6BUA4_9ZZZZ|nr:hypothetical protein [Actinomycetota bacterium]
MPRRSLAVLLTLSLIVGFANPAAADLNPIPSDDRERVLTKPWDSHLDPRKFWITYGALGGLSIMPRPVFLKNMTKEDFCETSLTNCVEQSQTVMASGQATFCAETQQVPCVEKLEIRKTGQTQWQTAKFENYWDATPSEATLTEFRKIVESQKNFSGIRQISTNKGWASNTALKLMGSGPGPLMFSAPEFPSKGGTTKYLVEPTFIQFLNNYRQGRFTSITYDTFYVNVRPIAEVTSPAAMASVEAVVLSASGKPMHMGFGVGAHNRNYYSVDGRYAYAAGFDSSLELQITMQIPSEIGGWFHSRLTDPNLQLSNISPGVSRLVISGASAEVPITNTAVEAFDPANEKYLDYTFGKNNEDMEYRRQNGGGGMAGGFWDPNNGLDSFKFWFSKIDEQAKGRISTWSVARMPIQRLGNNPCLNRTDRIQGLINTNAMVYQSLVPEYKNGFLNYEVMGVHKDLNGEVQRGQYDLIMRSDAARCLYRFSSAPVSGTITVVDSNGQPQVATTTLGESRGWLRLSAKNFTFSEKTVRVKLTQSRRSEITCVSRTNPGKIKKISGTKPRCPNGFRRSA